MTKVYALYRNHADEYEYYGVFSTEKKAERAVEIFSPVNKFGELFIEEFEIDKLEKFFDRVLSGYNFYHFQGRIHEWNGKKEFIGWDYTFESDLSYFLEDEEGTEYSFEHSGYFHVSVKAKSKEEATDSANKILEEWKKSNA